MRASPNAYAWSARIRDYELDRGLRSAADTAGVDTAKCWGYNFYGQLGIGNRTIYGDNLNEMGGNLPNIVLPSAPRAVAPGSGHACALLSTGQIHCWGYGSFGQLGNGRSSNVGDQPNEMGASLVAVDLGN